MFEGMLVILLAIVSKEIVTVVTIKLIDVIKNKFLRTYVVKIDNSFLSFWKGKSCSKFEVPSSTKI